MLWVSDRMQSACTVWTVAYSCRWAAGVRETHRDAGPDRFCTVNP